MQLISLAIVTALHRCFLWCTTGSTGAEELRLGHLTYTTGSTGAEELRLGHLTYSLMHDNVHGPTPQDSTTGVTGATRTSPLWLGIAWPITPVV